MVDHSSPLKSGKGVPSPWTRACCWWLSSPSRPMPCTTPRETDGSNMGGILKTQKIRIFPWRKWGLGQLSQKLQLFYGKPQDGLMDWCFSQSQFTIFWKDQFFGCCLLHDRVRWLFRHQARSNVHGVHVRLCHWPVYLWSLCGPGKAQTGIDLGHVAGQIGLCQTSFLIIFTKWWYPYFSAIFQLRVETSPGCVVHCCQFWKASWVRMAVAAKDSATSCGSWCASSKASCKRQDGRVRWPSWGTGFHRRGTWLTRCHPTWLAGESSINRYFHGKIIELDGELSSKPWSWWHQRVFVACLGENFKGMT